MAGWLGGWVGGGCYLTIRLSQLSLAGVRAGAELGKNLICLHWVKERYVIKGLAIIWETLVNFPLPIKTIATSQRKRRSKG